mmetsp:Transcript_34274/g.87033  ORF Transcript_34274/g.87033 Transcript_34274/m.87033 type:complete len:101 (+) Transcript_34274:277-579(+)
MHLESRHVSACPFALVAPVERSANFVLTDFERSANFFHTDAAAKLVVHTVVATNVVENGGDANRIQRKSSCTFDLSKQRIRQFHIDISEVWHFNRLCSAC